MSIPIVEPPFEPVRDGTVVGILLAAGTSRRFGDDNKLLAELDGEPVVRHAAGTLLATTLDEVVVIVGYQAAGVRDALNGLALEFVENPAYETGQATSVAAGIRAVRDRADAVLFALGDMPFVSPATIDSVIAAYSSGAGDAVAAAVDGDRGNPVLFDARFFDDLADLDGDIGGREILCGHPAAVLVESGDPGVRQDIDTPADLDRFRDEAA